LTRTGVVCALASERRTLGTTFAGLDARTAGMGSERAERAARELVAAGADHLLSWGFAGGLSPQLASGRLIVPTTVIEVDPDEPEHEPCPRTPTHAFVELLRERLAPLDPAPGRLASSATLVGHPTRKATLHLRTRAAAVDMESAAVGRVAAAAGLSWACVRAVVDDAHTGLPTSASVAVAADGRTALGPLLAALARRPWELVALVDLGRRARAAERALTAAATCSFGRPFG